jgi:hypothetical protein
MNGPITETAVFLPQEYPLTMQAGAGGSVSPPSGSFPRDAAVEIEAIPDTGFAFHSWAGTGQDSYNGTDNPATVTMYTPITQTATFVDAFPVLTMSAGPGGAVTPAGGPQPFRTDVTIEAVPDPGYALTGWTGEGDGSYTGTDNPAVVTMNEPLAQQAAFAQVSFPLEMIAGTGGAVSPASGPHLSFSTVQIEATPGPGYFFKGWRGEGDGSYTGPDPVAVVTMNGPVTQSADFAEGPAPDRGAFEVTLSLSDVDPHMHTGDAIGFGNVYLWLVCGTDGGITGLEADAAGTMTPILFQPQPGILYGGTGGHVELAMACRTGPSLLGRFVVAAPGDGSLCLASAAPTPSMFVQDCAQPVDTFPWPRDVRVTGVRTDGGVPCESGRPCGALLPGAPAVASPLMPAAIPSETALLGGVPNPFGAGTAVRFALAEAADVRLVVYDVAGRRVKGLAGARYAAGTHEVPWNGTNAQGSVVPAGVYFVRLEAGPHGETRKLLRLRR